jgi:hypothetical protein
MEEESKTMITALCWVRKGYTQSYAEKYELTEEEKKEIQGKIARSSEGQE